MFFLESAVGLMNHCVSGASKTTQPRSAGGRYTDYITPVECWWVGDVFKSCAGMSRKQANEIAKQVLPMYETQLSAPPKGESIYDCYDLQKQQAKPHYAKLFNDTRNKLIDLACPWTGYSGKFMLIPVLRPNETLFCNLFEIHMYQSTIWTRVTLLPGFKRARLL